MESTLKNKTHYELNDLEKVVYIESLGPFININYLDGKVLWYDCHFDKIEKNLPNEKFIKVNEQYIVNADFIKRVRLNNPKRVVLHKDFELEINNYKYIELVNFLKYKYVL